MKSVIFKAPILTSSGYGVHSRQVFKYLLRKSKELGFDLKVISTRWGGTPWILNSKDPIFEEIVKRIVGRVESKADVSIQLLLPNEWEDLGKKNIGMTAGIETNMASQKWIDCCKNVDEVIFPSEFSKNAFRNHEINNKLKVVPESYPESFDEEISSTDEDLIFSTKFNFLTVGQITHPDIGLDRKNLKKLITLFVKEFRDEEDVGLIVKTNMGTNTVFDNNKTVALINNILKEVGERKCKIHVLHGNMTETQMRKLYTHKDVKAFVTLTHGEGFGLPILEAARLGLPVIAPNWSAHTEFLNLGKYVDLKTNIVKVPAEKCDEDMFVKGSNWCDVSKEVFSTRVRKFYQSPDVPTQWAKDLSEKIKQKYSQAAIEKEYDKVLEKYLK